MTGAKARSGGKRSGAGRLPQSFHLSKKAARSLRNLTGHQKMINPELTALEVLEKLIFQAESQLNDLYEQNAEIALIGEVDTQK